MVRRVANRGAIRNHPSIDVPIHGAVVVAASGVVMATYYVNGTTGSNSNNGTSTTTPWLTIGKALATGTTVVAGDTINIAPGRYAETVTVAVSGSSGSPINIHGDADGAIFGTAGQIIWSGFTSGDDAAPTGVPCNIQANDWLTFEDLIFHGDDSNANASCVNSTATAQNITFRRCVFHCQGGGYGIHIQTNGTTQAFWTVDKCSFFGRGRGIQVTHALANQTSNTDLDIQITNCVFVVSVAGVQTTTSGTVGTPAGRPGGVDITNCTFIGGTYAFRQSSIQFSSAIPCTVTNCLALAHNTAGLNSAGVDGTTGATGAVTESYNRVVDCNLGLDNITQGTGTIVSGIHGIDAHASLIQNIMERAYFAPPVSGIVNGDGDSSVQPSLDILGDSRTGTSTVGAYLDTDLAPATASLAANPLGGFVG